MRFSWQLPTYRPLQKINTFLICLVMSVPITLKLSSAVYYYTQHLHICIKQDIYSIFSHKLCCLAGFRSSDSRPHEERRQKEKMKTDSDLNEYIWQTCILYESPVPINGLHEMNVKTSLKSCTDQMLYWPKLHRWGHAVINSVFVNWVLCGIYSE